MHTGKDAIRVDLERLLLTAVAGGYILSCDYRTPETLP